MTDGPTISEFRAPTADSGPQGITTGPDGALWFTELNGNKNGRLAPTIVNSHDLNGDGKSDIVWRDTSGNIAIWEMNGTTILNPNTAGGGNVTTTLYLFGTGDFYGRCQEDNPCLEPPGHIT